MVFFFNYTSTPEIYTLLHPPSLHDSIPTLAVFRNHLGCRKRKTPKTHKNPCRTLTDVGCWRNNARVPWAGKRLFGRRRGSGPRPEEQETEKTTNGKDEA